MSQTLDKIDPTFTDDLYVSRIAVYTATHWLNNRGHTVVCPPNKTRPEAKDRVDYSDYGDLQVALGKDGIRCAHEVESLETVEVKQRFNNEKYPNIDMNFQSRDAFPYPTVIVGLVNHYDKLDPEPIMTIIFNESLTGCLTVGREHRSSFKTVEKYVQKNGRKQTWYEVPKHLTTFYVVEL